MEFIEGIKVQYKELVADANGQSYIPWAAALAIAERPQQNVVMWKGNPARTLLGGAVVAIDMNGHRTWLPILDARNEAVPTSRLTSRDVNDAINRCRAKAIASVLGVGLGLYGKYDEAAAFLRALNVGPATDLAKMAPLTVKKGGDKGPSYVSWPAALAACRITDPEFSWEVIEYESVDPVSGEIGEQPYVVIGQSYMVSVKVTYKGQSHIEMLPIMGVVEVNGKRREHMALTTPTPHDWNRAVMRCLAKCIAVQSGYGLNVYAKEDLEALQTTFVGSGSQPAGASVEAINALRETLSRVDRSEDSLMTWLGKPGLALDTLTAAEIQRAMRALEPKAA